MRSGSPSKFKWMFPCTNLDLFRQNCNVPKLWKKFMEEVLHNPNLPQPVLAIFSSGKYLSVIFRAQLMFRCQWRLLIRWELRISFSFVFDYKAQRSSPFISIWALDQNNMKDKNGSNRRLTSHNLPSKYQPLKLRPLSDNRVLPIWQKSLDYDSDTFQVIKKISFKSFGSTIADFLFYLVIVCAHLFVRVTVDSINCKLYQ